MIGPEIKAIEQLTETKWVVYVEHDCPSCNRRFVSRGEANSVEDAESHEVAMEVMGRFQGRPCEECAGKKKRRGRPKKQTQ